MPGTRTFRRYLLLLAGVTALLTAPPSLGARMVPDKTELAVGEEITVKVTKKPLIAVITSWEATGALELVDSKDDTARVRGARAGAGTVSMRLNGSKSSLTLTVIGSANADRTTTPARGGAGTADNSTSTASNHSSGTQQPAGGSATNPTDGGHGAAEPASNEQRLSAVAEAIQAWDGNNPGDLFKAVKQANPDKSAIVSMRELNKAMTENRMPADIQQHATDIVNKQKSAQRGVKQTILDSRSRSLNNYLRDNRARSRAMYGYGDIGSWPGATDPDASMDVDYTIFGVDPDVTAEVRDQCGQDLLTDLVGRDSGLSLKDFDIVITAEGHEAAAGVFETEGGIDWAKRNMKRVTILYPDGRTKTFELGSGDPIREMAFEEHMAKFRDLATKNGDYDALFDARGFLNLRPFEYITNPETERLWNKYKDILSSFGVDYYKSRTNTATGGCLDMAKHLNEEVLTKKFEPKSKLKKTLKYVARGDNISRGVPGLDRIMASDPILGDPAYREVIDLAKRVGGASPEQIDAILQERFGDTPDAALQELGGKARRAILRMAEVSYQFEMDRIVLEVSDPAARQAALDKLASDMGIIADEGGDYTDLARSALEHITKMSEANKSGAIDEIRKNYTSLEKIRQADAGLIKQTTDYLSQTELGGKLLDKAGKLLKLGKTPIIATAEPQFRSAGVEFVGEIVDTARAKSLGVVEIAGSASMWAEVLDNVRTARSDAELAIALGRTLVNNTFFGMVLNTAYAGIVMGDNEALGKAIMYMLVPETALPALVEALGNTAINVGAQTLFDAQMEKVYIATTWDSGNTITDFAGLGMDGPTGARYFVDAMADGIPDLVAQDIIAKSKATDFGKGANALAIRTVGKAIKSTVDNGSPLVFKEDGPLQKACATIRKVTADITDLSKALGVEVALSANNAGDLPSGLDRGQTRAFLKLFEARETYRKEARQAMAEATVRTFTERRRAEASLDQGTAKAEYETLLKLFEQLGITKEGTASLEAEGAPYNLITDWWTATRDKQVTAVKAVQKFKDAYTTVLQYRSRAEADARNIMADNYVPDPRPLTGSLPLTARPEIDLGIAQSYLSDIAKVGPRTVKDMELIKKSPLEGAYDESVLKRLYETRYKYAYWSAMMKAASEAQQLHWTVEVLDKRALYAKHSEATGKTSALIAEDSAIQDEFRKHYGLEGDFTVELSGPEELVSGQQARLACAVKIMRTGSAQAEPLPADVASQFTYAWSSGKTSLGEDASPERAYQLDTVGKHTFTVEAKRRVLEAGKEKLKSVGKASWTVNVGANPGVTVSISGNTSAKPNETVALRALATAAKGTLPALKYAWTEGSRTLGDRSSTSFSAVGEGTYTVRLKVTAKVGNEWRSAGEAEHRISVSKAKEPEKQDKPDATKEPEKNGVPDKNDTVTGVPGKPAPAKQGAGGSVSGQFPGEPFNGMQISYSVSGCSLPEMKDSHSFTTSRSYKGRLGSGTLTVSGSARMGSGYGAGLAVYVSAGGEKKEHKSYIKSGWPGFNTDTFNLSVPIPPEATSASFRIGMSGEYNAGGRGLVVGGTCTADGPEGPAPKGTEALSVTLTGPKEPVPIGKDAEVSAQAKGGRFPYTFTWDGAAGSGEKAKARIKRPGSQTVAVSVSDSDGQRADASVTIQVAPLKLKLEGLPKQTYYGSNGRLTVSGLPDFAPAPATDLCPPPYDGPFCVDYKNSGTVNRAGNAPPVDTNKQHYIPDPDREDDAAPPSAYRFVWQSEPGLSFDPTTSGNGQTKVTFDRMGEVKVWTEVLQNIEGSWQTVGETDQVTVDVVAPAFSLKFTPASGQGKIGEEVRASVVAKPEVPAKLIDYRWFDPSSRMEYSDNASEIGFKIKDAKPVALKALARVPHHGDEIAEIADSYTGVTYEVKIDAPRANGPQLQVWVCDTQLGNARQCGMKDIPQGQFVTFQDITLKSQVTPAPPSPRYQWTVTPSGSCGWPGSGSELRLNCSNTGSYVVRLQVFDADKLLLGEAETSVSVSANGNDVKQAPKSKEAHEKMQQARQQAGNGQLDEAIASANSAAALDPNNSEAKDLGKRWSDERNTVRQQVERAKQALQANRPDDARKEIDAARKLQPNYPPVIEAERQVAEAQRTAAGKTAAASGTGASSPNASFGFVANAGIPGNNRETQNNFSVEECLQLCEARPWCKSVDYERQARRCYLQAVAQEDVGSLKTDYAGNPYDHYYHRQRLDKPDPNAGSTTSSAGLAGTWSINANNYVGKVEITEANGRLSGRVWYDAHKAWEPLQDISFDGRTVRFLRPGPNQWYTGTLSGNAIQGSFTSHGSTYKWSMTQVAGPAASSAAGASNAAGNWKTSEGTLTLDQNGRSVTGSYSSDGGEIVGEMNGNVLDGWWIENGANERCATPKNGRYYWGRIRWTFTDGKFAGNWSYCDKPITGGSGGWTGERIGAAPIGPSPVPGGRDYTSTIPSGQTGGPAAVSGKGLLVLEDDAGPYKWIDSTEVQTRQIQAGRAAFLSNGNDHFTHRLGLVGNYAGQYRYLDLWLYFDKPEADIQIQVQADGDWTHRWGFESGPKYNGYGWEMKGTTANLPSGRWLHQRIDLIGQLGIPAGQAITGIAFSSDGADVYYDAVYLQPSDALLPPPDIRPSGKMVLEDDAGPYKWIDATVVQTDVVGHGRAAFRSDGNDHFTADLGIVGDYPEQFRHLSLWVLPIGPEADIQIQVQADGDWGHRWGFDAGPKYNGYGWAMKGATTGLKPGVWQPLRLDLINDLGINPGQKITGVAFSSDGADVYYDSVYLQPNPNPAVKPNFQPTGKRVLEDDTGGYKWVDATEVQDYLVFSGSRAFKSNGNDHFTADLGVAGNGAGQFRNLGFWAFFMGPEADIQLQVQADGDWGHRWGFEAGPKYNGYGWSMHGTTTNMTSGRWTWVQVDLLDQLKLKPGDKITGLAFSSDGADVAYDSVYLLPSGASPGATTGSSAVNQGSTGYQGGASLRLERDRFAPGESILVHFTAPGGWPDNAWIGIIPSGIPHGDERQNDNHDISYQYLKKRTSGTMTFTAPKAGDWDFRLHDTDSNGKEFASASFRVGEVTPTGGRDYTSTISASPVSGSGGPETTFQGHRYRAILTPGGIDWASADRAARNLGGYLAVITSAAENDAVYSLVKNDDRYWFQDGYRNGIGPWLGGMQPSGSAEPRGGWRWLSNESFNYSNWSPGEPNNSNGTEDRLQLFGPGTLKGPYWNDMAGGNAAVKGYIVEFGDTGPATTIASGQTSVSFENGNIGGVSNSPTQPTTFALNEARILTLIQNYHWNSARGATPGSIALRGSDGRSYGPWQTVGTPGQGGVPNAYWTARPNEVLPAGTYTVIDSNPASWSHNSQSGYRGFTRVETAPVGSGPTVPGGRDYTAAPVQPGQLIFEVGNIGGVNNGPSRETKFSLSTPHTLTLIQNYHWNWGHGATPGTITLKGSDGRTYGPWPTTGRPGQGGVPNAYWTAYPNLTLPAGTYTVIDSDPATWSHNGESTNRGFVRVEGYPAGTAPAAASGNSKVDDLGKQVDDLFDAVKSLKGLFGK